MAVKTKRLRENPDHNQNLSSSCYSLTAPIYKCRQNSTTYFS